MKFTERARDLLLTRGTDISDLLFNLRDECLQIENGSELVDMMNANIGFPGARDLYHTRLGVLGRSELPGAMEASEYLIHLVVEWLEEGIQSKDLTLTSLREMGFEVDEVKKILVDEGDCVKAARTLGLIELELLREEQSQQLEEVRKEYSQQLEQIHMKEMMAFMRHR
jgi:hypothetical protein